MYTRAGGAGAAGRGVSDCVSPQTYVSPLIGLWLLSCVVRYGFLLVVFSLYCRRHLKPERQRKGKLELWLLPLPGPRPEGDTRGGEGPGLLAAVEAEAKVERAAPLGP